MGRGEGEMSRMKWLKNKIWKIVIFIKRLKGVVYCYEKFQTL